jgi:hypothetical protein
MSPESAPPAPAQLMAEAAATKFTIGDFDVSYCHVLRSNITPLITKRGLKLVMA